MAGGGAIPAIVPRRGPASARPDGRELLALGAVLAVAAVLRFAFLPTRGEFDLDQGHDMLVLRDLVTSGVIPLLGPPTSTGAGHHGAVYYYILAPAAFLNGARDPVPVVALLAVLGVAAVALTWWLARSIAGPIAGIVAAIVLAVSATSIQASTFIWNPSPMPAASALAFAAARKAWRDDAPAWWVVAGAGAMVTMQLHVLGALIVPPLAALWAAQVARSRQAGGIGRLVAAGAGAAVVMAAGYLPLAAHEIGSGFAETRAVLAYVSSGGEGTTLGPLLRVVVALLRTVGWPIAGPVLDAPAMSVVALALVSVVVGWRLVRGRGDERTMVAWLGGTLLFASTVLGLFVASASVVTPLPTDHYHAWLDPVVASIVGIGVAALVARPAPAATDAQGTAPTASTGRLVGIAAAVLVVGVIVAWGVAHLPPAVSPRGDWSAARATADRILAEAPPDGIGFLTLPPMKGPDAYGYPLTVSGRPPVDPAEARTVVVLCESLWVPDCGGPAESRALDSLGGRTAFVEVERLTPAPGRTVTILVRR